MKVIWLYIVPAPLPITMVWLWKFAKILCWQKFFLHLWQDIIMYYILSEIIIFMKTNV